MIRNVTDGEICIGNEVYTHSIALSASEVIDDWREVAVYELSVTDLQPLLAGQPEIIILGTGKHGLFAPREITYALARKGIGLEAMKTAAAARTFNVLAGEGRNVVAILYI